MGPDTAGFPSISSHVRRERRPISGGTGPDRSVRVISSRVRLRRAPIAGGMAPVTACRGPCPAMGPSIRRLVSCERWPSSGGRTPVRRLVTFEWQYAGQMPVTRPSLSAVTPAHEPSPRVVPRAASKSPVAISPVAWPVHAQLVGFVVEPGDGPSVSVASPKDSRVAPRARW